MTDWPSPESGQVVAPQAETAEQYIARRDAEISQWLADKAALEAAKAAEAKSRAAVTATLFPTPTKGTQRYDLNAGYKVKLVHGLNYKLGDKDKIGDDGQKIPVRKQVEALVERIAAVGNEGPLLADRLIKWTPELVPGEYEALDSDFEEQAKIRALVDEMLTVTAASPQLTFEEPKSK